MESFYGALPSETQTQLRNQHALQASTPGTLAHHDKLERRRPWQVLAAVLLITAVVVLVMIACGSSPAELGRLIDRMIIGF